MIRLDHLYAVDLALVRKAVIGWLSKLQHANPAALVTGTGVVFLALCSRFNVSPRRALEVAERVWRDATEQRKPEASALNQYLQHELDG